MPKKSIKRKPVSKIAVKKQITKSAKLVKKPVKKVIKKIAAKPVVKKVIKKVAAKKPIVKKVIKKLVVKSVPQEQKPIIITPIAGVKNVNPRSRFTMFVYWGIIFFFVCATFYILGRGHEILLKNNIMGTS